MGLARAIEIAIVFRCVISMLVRVRHLPLRILWRIGLQATLLTLRDAFRQFWDATQICVCEFWRKGGREWREGSGAEGPLIIPHQYILFHHHVLLHSMYSLTNMYYSAICFTPQYFLPHNIWWSKLRGRVHDIYGDTPMYRYPILYSSCRVYIYI